jgi:hypothetical protein
VELLAGDADAALPALTRAAATCVAFDFPIASVRAQLFLGLAREAKGDTAGACAAYGEVIARWHGATKSRTVIKARERATALGCK